MNAFLIALLAGSNLYESPPEITYPYSVPIINGGAELGDNTGWTVTTGFLIAATGPMGNGTLPHSGGYLFYAGVTSQSTAHQDVDVSALATNIDAGLLQLNWGYWQACAGADRQRVKIDFYDVSDSLVASSNPSFSSDGGANIWVEKTHSSPIPANTRKIRFTQDMVRLAGVSNDGYTDDITATIDYV